MVAVINAIHLQQIQRLRDIVRRAFLTGMDGDLKTQVPAPGEHPGKLFRWVADFRGIQPEAIQLIKKGLGQLQGLKGVCFRQVTQE